MRWRRKRPRAPKKDHTSGNRFGGDFVLYHSSPKLSPSWSILEHLEASSAHLGSILVLLGAILGANLLRARGDNHRVNGRPTPSRKKEVNVNGEGSPERPSSRVLRIKKPETRNCCMIRRRPGQRPGEFYMFIYCFLYVLIYVYVYEK